VAREAHLRERNQLHARAGGLRREVADAAEVVHLVARGVLKLDGRHTDVAHGGENCSAERAGVAVVMHSPSPGRGNGPQIPATSGMWIRVSRSPAALVIVADNSPQSPSTLFHEAPIRDGSRSRIPAPSPRAYGYRLTRARDRRST